MTWRGPAVASLLAVLLLALPADLSAQVHHLDDAPWQAVVDTTGRAGVTLSWDLLVGGPYHWRGDRVGLTMRLALGERGLVYLREHYVRLDTGDRGVLARWPHLANQDPDVTIPDFWPGEGIIEDFGQPELGMLMPLGIPVAGQGFLALQVALPFGIDELYPLASRCLALRFDWRRQEVPLGPVYLGARGGYETSFKSSSDVLDVGAFPAGWRYALDVGSSLSVRQGLRVGWTARELDTGRHQRQLDLMAWTTVGEGNILRLLLTRDLGHREHRYADWLIGLAWSVSPEPEAVPDAETR